MSRVLAGAGVEVPAWAIRVALGVVLIAAGALHAGDAWGWLAMSLGALAAASPWVQLAWAAMLSLALSELTQPAGAGTWHPYAVLAAVVLAHVLASRAAITPVRARVELRIFRRPLIVACVIALTSELLLALTLWERGRSHPTWAPATLVAALALLGLGALLFLRLFRRTE
ncbi:hypothetical protein GCM10022286_03340 [Gryllotalpicola daejeonensis]|uniref:Uncharacterized protein n=1 Tax=Gryllotalpicola daejeonensis TaxID=993087 RepID=A0ABP7ZE34_9MICO